MSNAPSKPITLILAVVVTCVVAAAGLAATYAVTKDQIAEQDRLAQQNSLKAAMPDGDSFEEVTDESVLSAAEAAAGDVQVNGHAETPGLGTKVVENDEFLGQFTGLPEAFTAKDVKAIDGISGATKSSRAVKNGVTAAGAIYADVLSKGGE